MIQPWVLTYDRIGDEGPRRMRPRAESSGDVLLPKSLTVKSRLRSRLDHMRRRLEGLARI